MTTKEMIAVMQAYEDGKQIQIFTTIGWEDWYMPSEPVWNWAYFNFRIKPEKEKPFRMTNRQLAEWGSGNHGQVRHKDSYVRTYHSYGQGEDDVLTREEILIRPWGFDEWIVPTVEIYERDCKAMREIAREAEE